MPKRIALFGEAERGNRGVAYYCDSLPQLLEYFGNPPHESKGLHCAVQALLYNFSIIYFPVKEEGFSHGDYSNGFISLEKDGHMVQVGALYLPGVGDKEIIGSVITLCERHSNLLITNEADFYDYLSS